MNVHFTRRIVSWALLLATLLASTGAWAAGRIQWTKTRVEEDDGSWRVEVKLFMNRAPDIAHVPMRFSFKPVVYYERTLVDGKDDPILRKVPLKHQQPIVESVDVGFLDPGRGEIQPRTKFSFRVTRGHGFEAGEYQVKVTNSRTGNQVGRETRLILEGENKVVDRRSMVFKGKEKAKDDEDDELDMGEPEPQERKLTPEDDAFWAGGPTEEESEPNGPPSIEEKPGGCGCRTTAGSGPRGAAAFALLGVGLVVLRRRGRQPAV